VSISKGACHRESYRHPLVPELNVTLLYTVTASDLDGTLGVSNHVVSESSHFIFNLYEKWGSGFDSHKTLRVKLNHDPPFPQQFAPISRKYSKLRW
jgi:hypothetical protein